ncbi:MAG: bifunctional enoyl-CoA hydratase/phosphate acetyltransferase [Bacillota bacterium]
MFENFRQIINRVKGMPKRRVCVAAAADDSVLAAVKKARQEQIADFLLVGHQDHIWRLALEVGLNLNGIDFIHEPDPIEATRIAVEKVATGEADVLMKGMVNSADLLRAILNPAYGFRTGNILSHIAALEIPGYQRLVYITDAGFNIAPDFEQKVAILNNAIKFMHTMGIPEPKVAVLSANEKVNPKMPSTIDAAKLAGMAERGEINGAFVEGPMALDVAFSAEAAEHKGIHNPVAGRADLLLVPDIEVGNAVSKAIMYFANGRMAGLVLGAAKPVVFASRAETAYGKATSIAMACYSVAQAEAAAGSR